MTNKERQISVKSGIEIGGVKYIQILIPDYQGNDELLALPLSNSGNSYNYANTRENVGHLTVQVNCYVKKDTMENLKALKESEEAKARLREQSEQNAKLAATLDKLSPLLNNPNLSKLLENPALLDKLGELEKQTAKTK